MKRDEAWEILCEYTKGEPLRKHGLAVEAAMRAYAGKYGEDEETWGCVGLLHDFDFEMHPTEEEHPSKGRRSCEKRACRRRSCTRCCATLRTWTGWAWSART